MRGVALIDRVELSMANQELRFWSPQIVVDVAATDDGARLDARFGPDPYVWGMYFLSYIGLTVVTFLCIAWGISQWILGRSPTGLYIAPGGAVIAGLVYGASYVGQGLGSEQMYLLRATLVELSDAHELEEPHRIVEEALLKSERGDR